MTKGEYMKQCGIKIKQDKLFLQDEADEEFKDMCDAAVGMQMMVDPVNHPAHYETGKFECFDVMCECLGYEVVLDFCIANAFKYIYRHRNKGGLEDVKKAQWYIGRYVEIMDGLNNEDC